jgi:hypothetical protein
VIVLERAAAGAGRLEAGHRSCFTACIPMQVQNQQLHYVVLQIYPVIPQNVMG